MSTSSGIAARNSSSGTPASFMDRGMPSSSISPSTASNNRRAALLVVVPAEDDPSDPGVLLRRDVGGVAGSRHELARQRRVVTQHMWQQQRVRPAVRDMELHPDRMRQRVVDAEEGVGERQAGQRRRIGHAGAGLDVACRPGTPWAATRRSSTRPARRTRRCRATRRSTPHPPAHGSARRARCPPSSSAATTPSASDRRSPCPAAGSSRSA